MICSAWTTTFEFLVGCSLAFEFAVGCVVTQTAEMRFQLHQFVEQAAPMGAALFARGAAQLQLLMVPLQALGLLFEGFVFSRQCRASILGCHNVSLARSMHRDIDFLHQQDDPAVIPCVGDGGERDPEGNMPSTPVGGVDLELSRPLG